MISTGHSGAGRATSIWGHPWVRSAVSITMSVSACAAFSPDGTRWQGAATAGSFDAIHRNREVLCLERLPRPAPLWASR